MTPTPARVTRSIASKRTCSSPSDRADVGSSRTRIFHVADERLRDLRQLAVGERQVADERLGVERQVVFLEEVPRVPLHEARLDQAERAVRFAAEEQVVRDRHRRDEAQVLVDDRDPGRSRCRRAPKVDLLPVDPDRARILLEHTGDDLDERGLARAVLAQERVDLAGPQVEFHAAQCVDAAEVLDDVGAFDEQRRGVAAGPASVVARRSLHLRVAGGVERHRRVLAAVVTSRALEPVPRPPAWGRVGATGGSGRPAPG